MKNKKAFSLIELSIVILIIGLVVVSVIGGSKLVQLSNLSKARALTNSSPVNGIEDLAMWYEATSKNSFSVASPVNGTAIATWNDINPQATAKNNVTQATPAYQPTYIANTINGLPGIRFDATNNNQRLQLNNSSFSGSTEFTVFSVFKFTAQNASSTCFFVINDPGISSDYVFAIKNSNQVVTTIWQPGTGTVGVLTSSSLTSNQLVILTTTYQPSINQAQLYLNGTLQSTATAPYLGKYSNSTITVGNYTDQPRTLGGDFGELIVFNRRLSSFEITQIQDYLSKKWGIKLN